MAYEIPHRHHAPPPFYAGAEIIDCEPEHVEHGSVVEHRHEVRPAILRILTEFWLNPVPSDIYFVRDLTPEAWDCAGELAWWTRFCASGAVRRATANSFWDRLLADRFEHWVLLMVDQTRPSWESSTIAE